MKQGCPGEASWCAADIDVDHIRRDLVVSDERLFYLLATASFVETTSDLFTRNLVAFFGAETEAGEWLKAKWEPEELQHGVALKRYVQAAWPDFPWEATYAGFVEDFARYCEDAQLESEPALELVARCVVETGTSSFYRMLAGATNEPVLRDLARHIAADEVRHYKHFLRYFLDCAGRRPTRFAVLRTLWKRVREIESDEGVISFRHIHRALNSGRDPDKGGYSRYQQSVRRLVVEHFPWPMAVKMMLKPLRLNAGTGRILAPFLASVAGFLL